MSSRYSTIVLLAVLSAPATAQNNVIPSNYNGVEGGGTSEGPARWVPLHMQNVYHGANIAVPTSLLNGIRYRRDGSTTNFNAHTEQVTMEVATQGVPEPEYSFVIYACNRGTNQTTVFSGQVNFPASTGNGGPYPFPFSLQFPFNSPIIYQSGSNLLVETTVAGTTFTDMGWLTDATPGVSLSPYGSQVTLGTGCPTTFTYTIFGGGVPYPGTCLTLTGPSGAAGPAPVINVLGYNNLSVDLTPIGMPGCSLFPDLIVVTTGITDNAGLVTSNWGTIPRSPALVGAPLIFQAFVLDLPFNGAGLRASQGRQMGIGPGFPVGLDAHTWYDRRDNSAVISLTADFRSTRTPIIEVF